MDDPVCRSGMVVPAECQDQVKLQAEPGCDGSGKRDEQLQIDTRLIGAGQFLHCHLYRCHWTHCSRHL